MTARHKRSAMSRASKPKAKRGRKQTKSSKRDQQPNYPENIYSESFRPKQMWSKKKELYRVYDGKRQNSIVSMTMPQWPKYSYLPRFQSVDQLADWVFDSAKYRPLKLNLNYCVHSEEVRDSMLRRFHRWPEVKIAAAENQFQTRSQEAQKQCQEQVQLYLQELRGKLKEGANALFWLDVLQPLTHFASVPRLEVREVLKALLQEIKSIHGVFEYLVTKSKRSLAVLALPLRLEPLFQGVSVLAQCGQVPAAKEAMDILTMFAEEYTAFPDRKTARMPMGTIVVESIGSFGPLDICSLSQLPQQFREKLAFPLSKMITDWLEIVEEVLDVLGKALTSQWLACECAPFEQELRKMNQSDLQNAFTRLSHALATDQLYAMRKKTQERLKCVEITVEREYGLLLVHLHHEDL